MALKSATSSTKSDRGIKAFVTFRVAGDHLVPEEVTNLLGATPTHAHRLGEQYSTQKSTIIGKTGVWLFSTDRIIVSRNLDEHLGLILVILGLLKPPSINSSSEVEFSTATKFLRLRRFLEERSLTATLTLFWHGPHGAAYPKVPSGLTELFELIPIQIEPDFDRDEETPRKTSKAA